MASAGTGDAVTQSTRMSSLRKLWLDLTKRSSLISKANSIEFRIGEDSGLRVLYEDAKGLLDKVWWACWTCADRVRRDKWMLLIACIIVDLIGAASYLILILAEVVDLWWAPICGFFLHFMFGSMLVTSFGAIEELLPLTDAIPTATICWCITHTQALGFVRNALGIKYPAIETVKVD
jgi:hypothetical protein